MADQVQLLTAMRFGDSAFPSGGFAFSSGLEGAHRDGTDFVLVMMVRRVNIASGTTEIFDLAQRRLDSFTLTDPLDTALVNDRKVMHGVTPIEPLDPTQPAYRDVLVATYRNSA